MFLRIQVGSACQTAKRPPDFTPPPPAEQFRRSTIARAGRRALHDIGGKFRLNVSAGA